LPPPCAAHAAETTRNRAARRASERGAAGEEHRRSTNAARYAPSERISMNNLNVHDLVPLIARHLDGFSPQTLSGTPYLMGPDGARLAVHLLMGRTEWIVVTGLYPVESPGLRGRSIVVTTTRGSKHIARKIVRRLLPKYLRDLKQQRARAVRYAERTDLVETLSAHLPGNSVTATEQAAVIRWRLGSMYGVFEVRDDATSIEISNSDRELAERVAYAINQRST
jgi:hypothetical protein